MVVQETISLKSIQIYVLQVVHSTLDNYEMELPNEEDEERSEAHHNWVDEVARCEGRCTPVADEFSPSDMIIRIWPERKDPSLLTRLIVFNICVIYEMGFLLAS